MNKEIINHIKQFPWVPGHLKQWSPPLSVKLIPHIHVGRNLLREPYVGFHFSWLGLCVWSAKTYSCKREWGWSYRTLFPVYYNKRLAYESFKSGFRKLTRLLVGKNTVTKNEAIDEILELKEFLSYDHIWKAIGPANRDRALLRLDKVTKYIEENHK